MNRSLFILITLSLFLSFQLTYSSLQNSEQENSIRNEYNTSHLNNRNHSKSKSLPEIARKNKSKEKTNNGNKFHNKHNINQEEAQNEAEAQNEFEAEAQFVNDNKEEDDNLEFIDDNIDDDKADIISEETEKIEHSKIEYKGIP